MGCVWCYISWCYINLYNWGPAFMAKASICSYTAMKQPYHLPSLCHCIPIYPPSIGCIFTMGPSLSLSPQALKRSTTRCQGHSRYTLATPLFDSSTRLKAAARPSIEHPPKIWYVHEVVWRWQLLVGTRLVALHPLLDGSKTAHSLLKTPLQLPAHAV